MIRWDVDTSELKRLPIRKNPARAQEIALNAFKITMNASLQIVREAVVKNTPFAFGFLRNSIQGTVTELETIGEIEGRLASSLQYALYVEEGTRPRRETGAAMPPEGPIRLWARRKLQLSGDELDRAVWFIRLKIYQRGTKAARMFELGFEQTEPRVSRLFEQALDVIADKITEELF